MKVKVKQVWDMKPPKDMTLIQVKIIADAVRKEGDEFFLTYDRDGNLIMRRISQ